MVRSLHHTNLVSFLESFRANGKLHLVFEFMDRTLLHDMEQMPHGIPEETVESYMLQLVQAVQFLHQNKVGSIPYKLTSGLAVMAHPPVRLFDLFRCATVDSFSISKQLIMFCCSGDVLSTPVFSHVTT